MSRSIDRESADRFREEQPNSRMPPSQGRAGGVGNESDSVRRPHRIRAHADRAGPRFAAEVVDVIDAAAADKPSMSEFIRRLEERGVQPLPSIQSSGRLNGMSYRSDGIVFNGSQLGRAYTAQGLQERKGVSFDPNRDGAALREAAERGGIRRPDRLEREPGGRSETARRTRDRETGLSADQKAMLADVGRFRTVAVNDLIKHRYGGNVARFDQDMRALSEAGLAQRRSVEHLRSGETFNVVVLTTRGRNSLRNSEATRGRGQKVYAGLVKPAEVRHDVGIYRMYQVEAARIERDGGKIRRVVLDFELKNRVFSAANSGGCEKGPDYDRRKCDAAAENDLKVVNGRVVFPDLRVEYETRDQEMTKVDLELATADYKSSQVRAKHAAGLKIYAPDSAAGSPAIQDPEIVAELISF